VRRTFRLVLALCALAVLAAPAALAAERMWVGFHDDPSFRWVNNRASRVQGSATDGAAIMRLLVQWNLVAPRRPSTASDPFDPAYNFDDLDEALREAQKSDLEVMLTLSGTPRWANGGRGINAMPRRLSDFTAFARAISSRYSGRNNGYPFVRFWSVWNEPNLTRFLKPQFNSRGRSVAPANYARLYAAAYTGIKAGNPRAKVAMGETSARGSDRPQGVRPDHSPGRFAEGVARANLRLRFDAWSHHPYPFNPNSRPGQVVRWPNVSLASLPRFNAELKRMFKRKNVPIWVTEYGHQTSPPDSFGVSYARQAQYIRESIAMAKRLPFVEMFIWFVYQDDPGQPWDSGVYTQRGASKGTSPRAFGAAARPLDARNAVYTFRAGTLTPSVTLYTRRYCVGDKAGEPIGITWRIFRSGRLIAVDQQTAPLRIDCTISVRLRFPRGGVQKGRTYTATFALNDINGIELTRRLTIRGT
jgi:Cellulase (glycosyl hydrolase family 5)